MKLSLEPVTRAGCEMARRWRNKVLDTLRTPFPLTEDQQDAFYKSLQDRNSPHRYWEVWDDSMVGLVGLTNIDWYNGSAEISLIISPQMRGKGIGSEAIDLVLSEAFERMRLHQVYGEVYFPNPAIEFWKRITEAYNGYTTRLPDRKFARGQHWDSIYFAVFADRFPKAR